MREIGHLVVASIAADAPASAAVASPRASAVAPGRRARHGEMRAIRALPFASPPLHATGIAASASLARQKLSATTATPPATGTTDLMPRRASAIEESWMKNRAPNTGGIAIAA